MIKAIIFDYNGLFGPDSDDWTSYRSIPVLTGLSEEELHELFDESWSTISIGRENLIDFFARVAAKSRKKITREQLLQAYLTDIIVYEEVLNFAKKLKEKGLQLFILSNETKEAMDFKLDKYHLNLVFDKVYCSADIGMTKRNPDAFKLVLDEQKLNPQETLFVDDRSHNVDTAKSFGMRGIIYKDFQQFEKELTKYL